MNSFEELKKTITEIIDERIDKKLDEFLRELLGTFPHGDCEKDNTMKEIEKLMGDRILFDRSHRTIHKPVKRMKKPNDIRCYSLKDLPIRGQEIFKDLISDRKTKESLKKNNKYFAFCDSDGTPYTFLVNVEENEEFLFYRIYI